MPMNRKIVDILCHYMKTHHGSINCWAYHAVLFSINWQFIKHFCSHQTESFEMWFICHIGDCDIFKFSSIPYYGFPGVTLEGWVMVIISTCSFLIPLEHYKV